MTFPLLNTDNASEFELRVGKVKESMRRHKADALLVASTVNLFYLTGGVCRGYFYIPLEGEPIFFMIPPAKATRQYEINIRKPEQIKEELINLGYLMPRKLGLEFDDLYFNDVERLRKVFAESEILNSSIILRETRQIKTPFEITKMREDGMKHCSVYSRIATCYREGMTDLEFQIEIERILRREGCLGYLRAAGSSMELNMGSVIAGDNALQPSPYDFTMGGSGVDPSLPVGASGVIIKPGMTVMVDMNGDFNGYQTDMTRCWRIGEVPENALKAHECSRMILRELEKTALPGVEIGQLYRTAIKIAEDNGYQEYFMGYRHKVKFIGHGVGIELNEMPVIMERNKSLLEENMTLAIEPKFVIPGVGAVGVENTYVVTDKGLFNLTPYDENLNILER